MADIGKPEAEGPRPENGHREIRIVGRDKEAGQLKGENPFFKPLNRREAEKPQAQYSQAKIAIEIINRIQNEEKVNAAQEDIENVRKFNKQFGDSDDAERIKEADEVIVYAQEVLKNTNVIIPEPEELGMDRTLAKAAGFEDLARRSIAKAQGKNLETGEDEETLTVKKAKEYLEVSGSKLEKAEEVKKEEDGSIRVADMFLAEVDLPSAPDGYQIFHHTKIKIGEDQEMPVTVYRRDDGSFVMNKLPTDRYGAENVKNLLESSKISEDVELPEDFDAKETDAKLKYLKEKYKLDTLESGLNVMPGFGRVPTVEDLPFKVLVNQVWQQALNGMPQPDEIPASITVPNMQAEILRRINSGDPKEVMPSYRDMRDLLQMVNHDPALQADLDTVLNPALQTQLSVIKELMDENYEVLINRMDSHAREALIGDIDESAKIALSTIHAGYRSLAEIMGQFKDQLSPANHPEIPGYEGIRAWYTYNTITHLEETHRVLERFEVQVDPYDNIHAALEAMNFFEKSRSTETYSIARDKLVRMRQAVENAHDDRISDELKDRFRKRIDAFENVNQLIIAMEHGEGDPSAMHKVAITFGNEEWHYFYDRFVAKEMVDENKISYFLNNHGKLLENVNILSETVNAFSYQYMVDRWRTNRVQEMTQRNLNAAAPVNADETWILNRLQNDIAARLATAVAAPAPDARLIADLTAAAADVNVVWNVSGRPDNSNGDEKWIPDNDTFDKIRTGVLRKWYEETTFIGADGYENGKLRTELWEDRVIQTTLRERLVNANVAVGRINDLLGTLQNPALPFDPITNPVLHEGNYDLMSAVERDGHAIAKFNLADSLDRLRIYTTDGKQVDTLWGEETPYLARAVTHFQDWLLNEGHGDPRVVRELIRATNEYWSGADINPNWRQSGQLLGQNNTSARIFGIEGMVLLPDNLKQRVKDLIEAETETNNDPERDVVGYILANQIMEGINPADTAATHDVNWDLVNINWGEASKNLKSYPIHDMLDDRQKAWRWYNEEFKNWLNMPTPDNFTAMMLKYYSGRNVRKHPGVEFFLRLQWRLGKHFKDWYGFQENMVTADMEEQIEVCERAGLIDSRRAKRLMDETAGPQPIRFFRELKELSAETARQTVAAPGWWAGRSWDAIWSFLKYLMTGK